jgi:prefoldin alpha subunit
MSDKEGIREKLIRYRILESRINALTSRRNLLVTKMLEIESTLNSIDEIEKSQDKEILIPIGSNVHVPGRLERIDRMIVELGANVAIENSVEETKRILGKRKKILENGLTVLEREIVNLSNEMLKLEPEIRDLIEKARRSR